MYILVKDNMPILVYIKSVSICGFGNIAYKNVSVHDATVYATEDLANEMLDRLYDDGDWIVQILET